MCVNHGRTHVTVAQQLLHSTNVCARLEQMRGKAVAQGMHSGVFGNTSLRKRFFKRTT